MFESVLHSLLCFLLWLTNLWHCVVDEVRNLATAHLAFSGLSEAQVKARARKWPKVPHHLCLAITDSAVTYDPVARLVMWAIAAGVKEITIWDNQGMCKASASLLQRYLEKAHVAYFGSSSDNYPLSFDAAEAQSKEGAVKIHLCDDEEGRPAIVNAIHTVVAQGKELTQEWLDNQLTQRVSEFDLVMLFSQHKLLHALLPWHLRVAEIHFCGSHRNISARTFVRSFGAFANCEQRFGQ